jgi:uncharacterized protein YacL (UPF0231 family)
MSICWNSRIIADSRFAGVSGEPAADGYRLKLTIVFNIQGWTHDQPIPVVRLSPAPVTACGENVEIHVGYAVPESTIPFTVYLQGATNGHLHLITLTGKAMEEVERLRAGQGIRLRLKLQGEVWKGYEVAPIHETVECRITQSDWLAALEQSNYGRTLLFEVPLPAVETANVLAPARYLQQAQKHFVRGHYDEAVGDCRKALEAIKSAADNQTAAMKAFKGGKEKELSLDQRELVIRQAVMNYLHPAHHHDDKEDIIRYDRSSAAMVLGLTASLIIRTEP